MNISLSRPRLLFLSGLLLPFSVNAGILDWDSHTTSSAEPWIAPVTNSPQVHTQTFNGAYSDFFDINITLDSSQQTMDWLDTDHSGGFIRNFPAVQPFVNGTTGEQSLGFRLDTSSGTVPAANSGFHAGNPPSYSTATPETIFFTIDFDATFGVSGVNFEIFELELINDLTIDFDGDGFMDGNWDQDAVTITGRSFSGGGTVVPTLSFETTAADSTYDIVGNSAFGTTHESPAHFDDSSTLNVDFGAQVIDQVTVAYEVRRITQVGAFSAGLGVGDINFTTQAPEPSSAFLLLIAGMAATFHRRRKR